MKTIIINDENINEQFTKKKLKSRAIGALIFFAIALSHSFVSSEIIIKIGVGNSFALLSYIFNELKVSG